MPFRASWSLSPAPAPLSPRTLLAFAPKTGVGIAGLGTDISAIPDLNWNTKSGIANLGEALTRRLGTPRGQLVYDPNYGLDLREWLNQALDATTLAQACIAIGNECLKDERVAACTALISTNENGSFDVQITATTTYGPFALVLGVSQIGGVQQIEVTT
jgi:phage baseplate assembly protein W